MKHAIQPTCETIFRSNDIVNIGKKSMTIT